MVRTFLHTFQFNPHWHELWKLEKYSSLTPPRGIFLEDSTSMTGYQIKLIDINFNLQKSLEILGKNSADKIKSKKIKGNKSALPHDN